MPHSANWKGKLGALLLYSFLRSLDATIRWRRVEPQPGPWPKVEGNAIYCIWHNRLALSLILYERFIRAAPQQRLAALVSASKDGGFLAETLCWFGVQPVRGSSSRRGAQALLELTTWAEQGYDVAITPDGPRGPAYQVQEGVIALAQLTGLPIVPVGSHLSSKISLKSWDRFQVPLPFSRCEVQFGPPLIVPRELPETSRAELRLELEKRLRSISRD